VEVAATSRGIAVDTASLAASQPHSRRGGGDVSPRPLGVGASLGKT
jgi:hypothetical protein